MPDAAERWDVEVDFVSVGSGSGGLSAAITAHDAGLETLILEKSGKVGGVLAYSGGEVWCGGNHLAHEAGIEDSLDEVQAACSDIHI
jgi:3-oxosteroid 1-dehydrogenase